MIFNAKKQKLHSVYSKVNVPEVELDTENEQYEQWEKNYSEKIKNNDPEPFKSSVK
jgi:hypothetical protein